MKKIDIQEVNVPQINLGKVELRQQTNPTSKVFDRVLQQQLLGQQDLEKPTQATLKIDVAEDEPTELLESSETLMDSVDKTKEEQPEGLGIIADIWVGQTVQETQTLRPPEDSILISALGKEQLVAGNDLDVEHIQKDFLQGKNDVSFSEELILKEKQNVTMPDLLVKVLPNQELLGKAPEQQTMQGLISEQALKSSLEKVRQENIQTVNLMKSDGTARLSQKLDSIFHPQSLTLTDETQVVEDTVRDQEIKKLLETDKNVVQGAKTESLEIQEEGNNENLVDLVSNLVSTKIGQQQGTTSNVVDAPKTPIISLNHPEDLSKVVVEQFEQLKEGSVSTIKLSLEPAQLGDLKIEMSLIDGKLTAKFLVEKGGTKDLLNKNIEQLIVNLTKQDVAVEKIQVVMQPSSQNMADFSGEFQGRQGEQQGTKFLKKTGNYREIQLQEEASLVEVEKEHVSILV